MVNKRPKESSLVLKNGTRLALLLFGSIRLVNSTEILYRSDATDALR
jgi:hypothetical protein